MKQKFSSAWIGSSKIRKQRKYLANAPLHLAHKFLAANLSKDLRKKYGMRNLPVRKNDEVKIMRGKFRGKTGKILVVNLKKRRVAIENIQIKKKDGTKVNVYIRPSKVQIINLALDDKKRLKRMKKVQEKTEKEETKQKEKKNVPEKK